MAIELIDIGTVALDGEDGDLARTAMIKINSSLTSLEDGKVDKVEGKGLSSNDFTTIQKNKLETIESGAQVNVPTNLSVTGRSATTLTITSSTGQSANLPLATPSLSGMMSASDKNKVEGIESGAQVNVPTNLSSVLNDTNVIIESSTGGDVVIPSATTTKSGVMSAQDKTSLVNLETAIINKVDKVAGKQLSTEDYTTSDKNKLDSISAGATVNSSDSHLLNRANHTGTQPVETITGLGTAATKDITTSKTDTTTGRLLKVGDFGIGADSNATFLSPTGLNPDNYTTQGVYVGNFTGIVPSESGTTAGSGWLVVLAGSSTNTCQQTFHNWDRSLSFQRFKYNDVWGSWQTVYTTENQLSLGTSASAARAALGLDTAATATVTTSVNDETTGRLLKVGDYGIGGASYSASTEHLDDMPVGHNWRINGTEAQMVARGAPALLEGSSTSTTSRHWNVVTYGTAARITQIASEVYGLGSVGSGRTFVRTKHDANWNPWMEFLTPKSAYLGTAATKNVGTTDGNVMEVGAGGWLGRTSGESYIATYPQSVVESISQIYRRNSSTSDGVGAYAARIHFATYDTWGRLSVLHNAERVWVSGGQSHTGAGWTVELFHKRNVLGTVSQSGGTPTGAIIESGSNASGRYIRYADGTQICYGVHQDNRTAAGVHTSTVTLPIAFASANHNPLANARSSAPATQGHGTIAGVTASDFQIASNRTDATNVTWSWVSIGRWY